MAKNTPAIEPEAPSTRPMVIAGVEFTISLPYSEGHVVTAAEAKTLNQTRAENISNAMRKKIEELKDVPGDETTEDGKPIMVGFSEEALQKAADMVAAYDADYTFAMGGAPRKALDPLEKEALSIARAEVTRLVKESGKKVKDIDPAIIEQNVEAFAQNPQVIDLARKRIAEKQQLASGLALAM